MFKSWLHDLSQKLSLKLSLKLSQTVSPQGLSPVSRQSGKRYLAAIVLAGLMLPLSGIGTALADDFNPPDRGLPGRRKGGGTRNPQSQCVLSEDQVLTALLPVTNLGLTIADYPQIFWFMPEHRASFVEISLYSSNIDFQDQDLLFLSQFKTTGEAGIGQFQVPEGINFAPLEAGQTYHWYVSLICDPNDRSQDVTVSGWLERVSPSSSLIKDGPGEIDRYKALLNEGIWFDALNSLATLQCTQPENAATLWQTLLADSQVGLAELSPMPWLETCQNPLR